MNETDTAHDAILEVRDVTITFGGVRALAKVTFDVRRDSLSAIIGPNGAGKTSMFNCMTGIYRPNEGTIAFEGKPVGGLPQHKIARLGIARTFQNLALFRGLSVLDNLMVGRYLHSKTGLFSGMLYLPHVVRDDARNRAKVEEIMELLEIEQFRSIPVGDLPYGVQKRVELGRALAQEGRLLLLDEPMAGMTLEEKQDMVRFIYEVRRTLHPTIVLVEHDMSVVMEVAENVVVLDFGEKIADGPPSLVQRDVRVVEAYLGTKHAKADEPAQAPSPSTATATA